MRLQLLLMVSPNKPPSNAGSSSARALQKKFAKQFQG
jgi:hypothetical protein